MEMELIDDDVSDLVTRRLSALGSELEQPNRNERIGAVAKAQ
jgi:hypothetical protein